MNKPDLLAALEPVIKAFNKLDIPYCIGGSIASSAYGMARSTLDVDVVAIIRQRHVIPFSSMLETLYYVDKKMISDAIERCSAFNIIHLKTMLKIDVFIASETEYSEETFKRRRLELLDEEYNSSLYYLVSAEDIILNKLLWYQLGNEISERQWLDVLGVLKVQRDNLDIQYLKMWAQKLKIIDLLCKAFKEIGITAI